MDTKTCSTCKIEKDIESFSKKGDIRQSICKPCHSEYRKKHYLKNKKKYIEKAKRNKNKRRKEFSDRINKIKDVPCADCGKKFHPCAMDFDHINDNKFASVAKLAQNFSWNIIEKEMKKCEIVCSNCHRIRTWKRLNKI